MHRRIFYLIYINHLTFVKRVGKAIRGSIEAELSRWREISGRRCCYRVVLRRGAKLRLIMRPRRRVRGYTL